MARGEIRRLIKTNVSDAYGYVVEGPTMFYWVFRYDPGASGEFHIYEHGSVSSIKKAVDEIYSCANEYDFTITSEKEK